jgi:hypothetical protein
VIRPYPILRSDSATVRLPFRLDPPQSDRPLPPVNRAIVKERILLFARVLFPSLLALTLTTAAHAQGTMDFSGAQTLMGTFKTLTAYLRRADEGTLSRMLVEATILLAASRHNGTNVLRDAATLYKVDTDAIASKVKQEFAAKAKAKKEAGPAPKVKKAA